MFDQLRSLLDCMEISMNKLQNDYQDLVTEHDNLVREHDDLKNEHTKLITLNKDLQESLHLLQKEQECFMRVSQRIAFEKENFRLQNEVKRLKELLEKDKPNNTSKPLEQEHDEPIMYVKKINKKLYFVTDDDQHLIYEYISEDECGKELGYMQTVNGKLKPVFNDQS